MGDQPVDVFRLQPVGRQGFLQDAGQIGDGVTENFLSHHAYLPDRPGRGRPAVGVQQIVQSAVGMEVGGKYAPIGAGAGAIAGAQDHRPGAVAEQHAGVTVLPVDDAREGLGPDDQRGFGPARLDETVGHGEAVYETGTHGLDIEGGGLGGADQSLHLGRRRREGLVRGRGGEHDEVNILRRLARRLQGRLGGGRPEHGGFLVFGGDAPFTDAGAFVDPFVGGIHRPGKFVVGDDAFREMGAAPGNDGPDDHYEAATCCGERWSSLTPLSSSMIWSLKP